MKDCGQKGYRRTKPDNIFPIKIFYDNVSTINIAENLLQHDDSKHVEIDRRFITEKIEAQVIEIEHVLSRDQVVDVFTKLVSTQILQTLVHKLSV